MICGGECRFTHKAKAPKLLNSSSNPAPRVHVAVVVGALEAHLYHLQRRPLVVSVLKHVGHSVF